MATHSSVLAWRIPGTGEPGGLPSLGLHRVRHDWSDLAAAAAYLIYHVVLVLDVQQSGSVIYIYIYIYSCCSCSVAQSCPILWDPMDCSMQASLPFTISWSLLKLMSIKSMMPSNHLIFCYPLLFLPSIFPRIRVFSNESAFRIMWPKYWRYSFSIFQ